MILPDLSEFGLHFAASALGSRSGRSQRGIPKKIKQASPCHGTGVTFDPFSDPLVIPHEVAVLPTLFHGGATVSVTSVLTKLKLGRAFAICLNGLRCVGALGLGLILPHGNGELSALNLT